MVRVPILQIYLYKGRKIVVRSASKNIYEPTPAQMEVRERFKEVAHKSKGMKMEGDMPPSAEIVAEEMKGYRSKSKKRKLKVWQKEMEEYVRENVEEKANEVLRRLGIEVEKSYR